MFYVTAADKIQKRLPVNNIFLSKLKVLQYFEILCDIDREKFFNDVVFIATTIGGFDVEALKKELDCIAIRFYGKRKIKFFYTKF